MAGNCNVSIFPENGYRNNKYIRKEKPNKMITCDYCGADYSLENYLEDKNLCPDCNIYYGIVEEVYRNLCTTQNDIMSLFVHLKKRDILTEPSRQILQKIYQSLYSIKRDISIRRGI
ncbi:MAG: hypothetical protein JW737_10185 [Acidobacteria bacterium]|nr:hypothetical protein [Acidobacteriota bacterium]